MVCIHTLAPGSVAAYHQSGATAYYQSGVAAAKVVVEIGVNHNVNLVLKGRPLSYQVHDTVA